MSSTFVVVNSCAAYSDAWKPFMRLFRKYWPYCPYDVVLVTDVEADKWEGDITIALGQDEGWIKNLAKGLERFSLDSKILLLQEDFFLSEFVNWQVVELAIKKLQDNKDVSCIRLMPCPGPDHKLDDLFGLIDEGAAYRVSCQAALWPCDYLSSLLAKLITDHGASSPADFEIVGTRIKYPGEFLSVYRDLPFPLPYLVSAISRGQWNPDAITLCEKNNIPIDLSRRAIQ